MCQTRWLVPSSPICSGTAGSPMSTSRTRWVCPRRPACAGSRRWRPTGSPSAHGARAAQPRADLGLTVFVGLKVDKHSRETSSRVEEALLAIPAVVGCYLVSGGDDFLIEA